MVKLFPTVLKIRIFLTGSTPHLIGLYHAVNKLVSCCKLTSGGGLGTGEHLKREWGCFWNSEEGNSQRKNLSEALPSGHRGMGALRKLLKKHFFYFTILLDSENKSCSAHPLLTGRRVCVHFLWLHSAPPPPPITNYHNLGSLNNRNLFWYSSAD